MSNQTSDTGGIFLSVLTLVFVVLKLNPGGHLDSPVQNWSWVWVLAPMWIPFLLGLLVFVVVLIAMLRR